MNVLNRKLIIQTSSNILLYNEEEEKKEFNITEKFFQMVLE